MANLMAYRTDYLIQDLLSDHRPGRPKNPKLILLQSLKATEEQEFKLGSLEIPDLTLQNVVDSLMNWDGDFNATSSIALKRVKKSLFENIDDSKSNDLEKYNEKKNDSDHDMDSNIL